MHNMSIQPKKERKTTKRQTITLMAEPKVKGIYISLRRKIGSSDQH